MCTFITFACITQVPDSREREREKGRSSRRNERSSHAIAVVGEEGSADVAKVGAKTVVKV